MISNSLTQDRSTSPQQITRRSLLGLLFTIALSSIVCAGLALTEANDKMTIHPHVVKPGEKICIAWQTTLPGTNYIAVTSLETNKIVAVIPTTGKPDEVYYENWSTPHPGKYRFDLRHRDGFKSVVENDILTVTN